MEKKVAIFAFNGEPMCFVHALLNSLDMKEKGYDVKLVIEGSATKLVKMFMDPHEPFADLYKKVKKGQIKAIKVGRAYAVPKKQLGYILGKELGPQSKKEIDEAVKKTIKDYGQTLKLLGRE